MRQVNLRLPGTLLEAVEEARGQVPRDRWIRQVLRERVGAEAELSSTMTRPEAPAPPSVTARLSPDDRREDLGDRTAFFRRATQS
jgi:hypothetical protein